MGGITSWRHKKKAEAQFGNFNCISTEVGTAEEESAARSACERRKLISSTFGAERTVRLDSSYPGRG
eukprot:12888-Heterococcus_DN1.PRE.1